MQKYLLRKIAIFSISVAALLPCSGILANTSDIDTNNGLVAKQIFKQAQSNNNWKYAFLTGKHAQIVFMSISPSTNPKNEIGMEVHPFDQVILVVEGVGEAILSDKTWMINAGDMIFIPQGVAHNIINLSQNNAPMKIISFYSSQDIPIKAVYATKKDQKK